MNPVVITLAALLLFPLSLSSQKRKERLDSVVRNLALKEVVVQGKKIRQRGDTISYSAATYRSATDKTLSDLLRKMPGIEVKEDGQVIYNGQWIKEFYIEGMNMLGENYGVATNNIDAKAIGSVEVMERHQDVKMLQGVEKGRAPAMNIKLKEDAKGVWSRQLSAAFGVQPGFSRALSANVMTFRRRSQNISVAKSDNVGDDLRKEIKAPATIGNSLGSSLLIPGKPGLDNRLSYLNDSHSVSINQLFRLKENNFLTFNANYLYDREKRDSENITSYLTDSLSRYVFHDLNAAVGHQHYAGINAVYKVNTDKSYLRNNLSANLSIPDGNGQIGEEISQSLMGHAIALSDVFEFKHRRIGGGIGDTRVQLRYTDRLGTLRVPEIALCQGLSRRNLRFGGATSLIALMKPHIMFNLNGGVMADYHQARVQMDKSDVESDGRGESWNITPYLTPNLLLHRGSKLQWNINIPIGARFYTFSETHRNQQKWFLYFRPSTYLTYGFSGRWSATLNASREDEIPDLLTMMEATHYSNYRTLFSNAGNVKMRPDITVKGMVSVDYKSILKMMFANVAVSVSQQKCSITEGYRVAEGEIHYALFDRATIIKMVRIDQSFSKGFFRGNSKFSEELSAGINTGDYLVDEISHRGRKLYLRGTLGYRSSFTRWLTLDTSNTLSLTKSYTDGVSDGKVRNSFSSFTSLIVSPFRHLSFYPAVAYYHNNYSSAYRDNVFLNCRIEYSIGEVTLSFEGRNLLDNTVFRRFTDNGIISRSNEYKLRGRTLMAGIRIKVF